MKPCRASRPGLGLLALLLAAAPGAAEERALLPPVIGLSDLYASRSGTGLALAGLDPVSYRLGPAPAIGLATVEAIREGLCWRFAGPANRAAFLRDPESFLPRLGGLDAAALAAGRIAEADPALFALAAGRLYLFRSTASRALFLGDPDAPARAEARWQILRPGLAGG